MGAVKLWDTATCQEVATLEPHTRTVRGLEFADDDTLFRYTDPPLNELDAMR